MHHFGPMHFRARPSMSAKSEVYLAGESFFEKCTERVLITGYPTIVSYLLVICWVHELIEMCKI